MSYDFLMYTQNYNNF